MREILFRGKKLNSDEWLYGDILQINRDSYTLNDGLDSRSKVDERTISQYIGLKDTAGEKIFEFDIINFFKKDFNGFVDYSQNFLGVVEWDEYYCCWLVNGIKCGVFKFGVDIALESINVVGNIFDNCNF